MARCIGYVPLGLVLILLMLSSVGAAAQVSHELPAETTIGKPYQQVRVTVFSTERWRGISGGTLYWADAQETVMKKLDHVNKDPEMAPADNKTSPFPQQPDGWRNQTNLADGNESFYFNFTVTRSMATAGGAYRFIVNISFTTPPETKQFRISTTAVVGPVADFSWKTSWREWGPTAGRTLSFRDQSREGHADIVSWQWDFGDGGTSSQRHPEHVYSQRGTYTVTLTIQDAQGQNDTYWQRVRVQGESAVSPLMVAGLVLVAGGGVVAAVVWRRRRGGKPA